MATKKGQPSKKKTSRQVSLRAYSREDRFVKTGRYNQDDRNDKDQLVGAMQRLADAQERIAEAMEQDLALKKIQEKRLDDLMKMIMPVFKVAAEKAFEG